MRMHVTLRHGGSGLTLSRSRESLQVDCKRYDCLGGISHGIIGH